jgi:hypothetical protein
MSTDELNRLLEKYYSGTSDSSEEAQLRDFFSSGNIPDGYEAEKAMFGYFSEHAIIPQPSDDFESRIIHEIEKHEKLSVIKRAFPFIGIAAAILIIAGIWIFFEKNRSQEDTFRDPQIAYAETMKVLLSVSRQLNHAEDKLKPVTMINEVSDAGFGKISRSTSLIEDNLKSLNYMKKAIDISTASQDNK